MIAPGSARRSTALLAFGLGAGVVRRRILDRHRCAETWTSGAPRALAARAPPFRRRAPCTASKRCRPRSNRMPTRLIATSASRTAAVDRIRVAQIGLHGVDLADPAERLQMAGELRPAHRDADAVAALGERPHHMAAEETRAAEDRDERCRCWLLGHAAHRLGGANTGSDSAPVYGKGLG